jgi:hypothetical protein
MRVMFCPRFSASPIFGTLAGVPGQDEARHNARMLEAGQHFL